MIIQLRESYPFQGVCVDILPTALYLFIFISRH